MHDHGSGSGGLSAEVLFTLPFLFALSLYLIGVGIQIHRGRSWPGHRAVAWVSGIITAASGFIGPLASAAHDDFVAHMWAHLLVGMIAPLLLVIAAPMTLALRSLQVTPARRMSRLLTNWPARFLTAPIVAGILNIGGMWLLYSTPLYQAMQADMLLHLLVMMHFLLAGYLFTVALIPIDPAPHRASYPLRIVVLVIALAAHNILAKTVYANPPAGASVDEAQAGSLLMYYAGDVVDIVIITILCAQWYRDAGRNFRRNTKGQKPMATAS